MNALFQSALKREPTKIPPIWFMRQAGRYHKHYQGLRAKHSFMELCKIPELAAEVAMGPIRDFEFDVAILFSDLLFPLDALGMGLSYPDTAGPTLSWHISRKEDISKFRSRDEALPFVQFQKEALLATKEKLPENTSLIGFVGGPWTLFCYAVQGKHEGSLLESKKLLPLFPQFCEHMMPFISANIALQLEANPDLVMIFDTAAGELSPVEYQKWIYPCIKELAERFNNKIGYYGKPLSGGHLRLLQELPLAGVGIDHRLDLMSILQSKHSGFIQGNFDQALLHQDSAQFKESLNRYLAPLLEMSPEDRKGWVCGLGHGVLPKSPEINVRYFVDHVRESFAKR